MTLYTMIFYQEVELVSLYCANICGCRETCWRDPTRFLINVELNFIYDDICSVGIICDRLLWIYIDWTLWLFGIGFWYFKMPIIYSWIDKQGFWNKSIREGFLNNRCLSGTCSNATGLKSRFLTDRKNRSEVENKYKIDLYRNSSRILKFMGWNWKSGNWSCF
jgi:hypothetical protein